MRRLIYLAYPIDNAMMTERLIAEINKAKNALLSHDTLPAATVFDPGDAFLVRTGAETGPEISMVNGAAIDTADGVLAFLPKGVPSIGVPMEIARAGLVGKPVAVVTDSYSWAVHLGKPNVRVFLEAHVEAAIEWLLSYEYDPGELEHEPLPFVGDPWHAPTRAYDDDAGLDLRVAGSTILKWGQFVDVPLGVKVALPPWSWGLLTGRSSTFRNRGIEVLPGIIDAGWRGELFAACIWRPDGVPPEDRETAFVEIEGGDRIAQLIIIPNGTRDVKPVAAVALAPHERGENGFGSSGV